MSELVAVVMPPGRKAEEAYRALEDLAAADSLGLSRTAVLVKDATGQAFVIQRVAAGVSGATAGALIGGLSGTVGGAVGAGVGAVAGALVGWAADRLNDSDRAKFIQTVSRDLSAGGEALLAEVSRYSGTSLETRMAAIDGKIIRA